jgi:hypothetical protein
MRHHFNLLVSNMRNRDRITQVANTIFNLDLVVEKLLERRQIKDLVTDGLGAVDGVLVSKGQSRHARCYLIVVHTFFVTLAGLPFCGMKQFLAYCSKSQRC